MNNWNQRYEKGEHTGDVPHPLIVRFASSLVPGRALDLACGVGRHALFLAQRGWNVTAVDSSNVAMDILQRRAQEKAIVVHSCIADLERHEFAIAPDAYDLIIVCNYLQRDLFPAIKAGIRAGGTVIAVIALIDDDPEVKPMNPAYLLNPGELRAAFEGFELVHDFEGKTGPGHQRAVAEIVARQI